ncbi:hypothetical protein TSMEX_001608 [Taenia solium]|eukprot:TsM_000601200 transcript=TsM_000601200 gene=TsM_000601200
MTNDLDAKDADFGLMRKTKIYRRVRGTVRPPVPAFAHHGPMALALFFKRPTSLEGSPSSEVDGTRVVSHKLLITKPDTDGGGVADASVEIADSLFQQGERCLRVASRPMPGDVSPLTTTLSHSNDFLTASLSIIPADSWICPLLAAKQRAYHLPKRTPITPK